MRILACCLVCASAFRPVVRRAAQPRDVRAFGFLDDLASWQKKLNELQLNKLDEKNLPPELAEYSEMKDKARAGEKLPSVAPWASDDDTAPRAAPDSDKPPGGIFGGWQNDMGKTIIAEKAERTATSALRKAIAAEDAEAVRAALQEALDVAAQYGGRPTPSYGQSTEKELAETIVEAQAFVQGDAAAADSPADAPAVSPADAAES